VKKKPGALWLFFYGRQRRGFPWLLAGLVIAVIALSLAFRVPPPLIGLAFIALLIVGTIVAVVAALLRPRKTK
jgi:hypothetical protein